jgi:cell division protein FtsQ
MPPVKGTTRKKAPAKSRQAVARKTGRKSGGRSKAANRGMMENLGASADALLHNAVQKLIAYTAVCAAALGILAIMMLFLGGYFNDIGGHAGNLAKGTAKAAGFEIERITLKGRAQSRKLDIVNALYDETFGQALGQSLLHYDASDARARVEQVGWVKHAAVSRLWPNTLHVSITERTPAALWQHDGVGELFLIDMEGVMITPIEGHQYTGLPMVLNTNEPDKARDILTPLARYPHLSKRIAAVRRQGDRRWDLIFRNDFIVMLPEDDYESAITRLAKLEEAGQGKSRPSDKFEYLNMRDSKSVYYKPRA